jgi:hypothetical protein
MQPQDAIKEHHPEYFRGRRARTDKSTSFAAQTITTLGLFELEKQKDFYSEGYRNHWSKIMPRTRYTHGMSVTEQPYRTWYSRAPFDSLAFGRSQLHFKIRVECGTCWAEDYSVTWCSYVPIYGTRNKCHKNVTESEKESNRKLRRFYRFG